jgi:hypothetical protein
MATTSGNLAAGKALAAGRNGGGKGGNKGRAGLLVATAALGLSVVVGGALGLGRQATQPVAVQVGSNASAVVQPVDASTNGSYRWDFGQVRPVDASVAGEYRWSFVPLVPALDWEQQERTQVAPGAFTPANVALVQTLAGNGYLEFSPSETAVIATPASGAAANGVLSEFLPSDEPTSDGGGVPSPVFGPQP